MDKKVFVTKPSIPTLDEYIDEIKDIFDSHQLTNFGPKHNLLKKKLEEYFDVKHVSLFVNGHSALECAIDVFDFSKGSEIITTPFTFVSTTNAIVRCGMKPVFCDINENDYTIDVSKIEGLITDKTVAIIPVHVYGNVCNVEEIDRIAKKHNLKVIYDAAHVFGVKYKDKSIASYGDISMFSFHATKVFNTIEGGCLCFSDDNKADKLEQLKDFGIVDAESVKYIGGNAKMNELQAAMGICNLRHIDQWIKDRKAVVEHYRKRLSGVEGIKLSKIQSDVTSNYAYLPVVFENYKYTRDEIFNKLSEKAIYARKYFYPLTYELECYRDRKVDCPLAHKISQNVLTLPLYPDIDKEIIDTICDIILK